jgi:uncharacterized protein
MLPQFRHDIVRDLAWVAFSPPLLDGSTLPQRDPLQDSIWRANPDALLQRLQRLDDATAELAALFPAARDRRLGNYYERLWHALLTLAPDVSIVAHNIALREDGRTLGELDLIIRAANGEVVHLEIAIKFYLGRPELMTTASSCSDPTLWWGPDPRDQLARKVDRLRNHQLPLVSQLAAHCSQPLPQPDYSAAWLQGYLFQSAAQRMPPACGQQTRPGQHWWCQRHQVTQLLANNSQWLAIPHKDWLMPPRAEAELLLRPEQMTEVFEKARARQAVMFARVDSVAEYQALHADRLICVADDWPA